MQQEQEEFFHRRSLSLFIILIMKYWPVPDSYSKIIPTSNSQGSFWADRGDRRHCGIDIYAPVGSKVLSIEDGLVVEVGLFTSPAVLPYWNVTKYLVIKTTDGLFCKYAELGKVTVTVREFVKSGQIIGYIGLVLNIDKISDNSPKYIQKIKRKTNAKTL